MNTTALPGTPGKLAAQSRWAVETHGLTKRFGANTAVNDVELLVPRGSAFGYLGPNGAGKTTLIRVLLGLTHADAGTMSLLGYPVPRHRDAALARTGAIVDEPRFHGHLTGRQNLRLLAAAREPAARDRIGPVLERVGLAHRANDRVSAYSMGMRQRLGVAACLFFGLPGVTGGSGGPGGALLPESAIQAICVIIAWLAGWTILGAWRMMTRDA
jgi:ABC-type branched-subunit amino acid transport system ATPase component